MKREVRFMQSIELRTDNGKSVIRGYAAKFNSLSEDLGGFREKIAPGAFSNAIECDDVRALVGHDPDKIIGRNKAGTLSLREDDTGLYCEIAPPDTGAGRDVVQSIKRGDLDGMSFGFGTVSDDWGPADESGLRVRELREVKLYDVSVVTYPAYPETSVSMRALLFPDGQPGGKKENRGSDMAAAMKATKKALAMHREDMNADDPDDATMEQHLMEAIKQMGGDPEDLESDNDDETQEEKDQQALNNSGNIAAGGDDKTQLESRGTEQRKRVDSAEAQLDAKRQALCEALFERFGYDYYGPIETYDDHIIAAGYDDADDCQYFSIPYTVGSDGAITYGEPSPVELDWVPSDRAKALAAEYRAVRKNGKTKKVDGKDLHASDFAYVGDPEKTETWKLPIHDANHVRNALARFDQTEGIPEDERPKVLAKIHAAAKKFGIDVSEKKSLSMIDKIRRMSESSSVDFEAERKKEEELSRQRRVDAMQAERDKWEVPTN